MKKFKIIPAAFLLLFALAFTGCQGKEKEPTIDNKEIFEEELTPLSEDEVAELDAAFDSDEEMRALEESELESLGGDAGEIETDSGKSLLDETDLDAAG